MPTKNSLICHLFEVIYRKHLSYVSVHGIIRHHKIEVVWSWKRFSYDYCGRHTVSVVMPWEEDYLPTNKVGKAIAWIANKFMVRNNA
jgi:hypothetical protein